MTKSYPDTLILSRRVLRVLIKLNLLMGAFILALLIASLISESWVMRALGRGLHRQFDAVRGHALDHGDRPLREFQLCTWF